MSHLIRSLRTAPEFDVLPPQAQPRVTGGHVLPADLATFYSLCGGITLYRDAEYPIAVVPANQFVPANPVIVGDLCEYDITSTWYILARDGNGEYLTIDLSPERNGRCYDSFYERHGVRGSCPIIATSFTDLLERLIANRGGHYHWLRSDFMTLGDAYD